VFQLLLKAGGEGKHTVFLFSDSQIKDESFMEDISMILNTGDVPNLYAADEKAEIIEKMQGMARKEVYAFLYCYFIDFIQICTDIKKQHDRSTMCKEIDNGRRLTQQRVRCRRLACIQPMIAG